MGKRGTGENLESHTKYPGNSKQILEPRGDTSNVLGSAMAILNPFGYRAIY